MALGYVIDQEYCKISNSCPKILFIDDEPKFLNGLRRALYYRRQHWDMHFASSANNAILLSKENDFSVVVTDMDMPDFNGIEIIAVLRKINTRTVFIMLTGINDLKVATDSINQAGVFRFYSKPCTPETLQEGIETALARPSFKKRHPYSRTELLETSVATYFDRALDALPIGVMMATSDSKIVYTNTIGAEFLTQADGLSVDHQGYCRTYDVNEGRTLHILIASTMHRQDDGCNERGGALSISRRAMGRPYSVLVFPASETTLGIDDRQPTAILYVTDPERQTVPDIHTLRALFSFTIAEARLVRSLVQGNDIKKAAQELGITSSTARSYLKQIFFKTDTNKQTELIRLVLMSTALIGVDD